MKVLRLSQPQRQIKPIDTRASHGIKVTPQPTPGSTSTLDIDLTWTGTGELVRETDRFHSHAPGVNYQSRFNGRFRDAEASGSVSLGGVNLAAQPPEFARIGSVKEGEVTIE